MESCVIELTKAAHKYGNLNIRPCGKKFFPEDVFGGPSRKAGLGVQITMRAEGLPNVVKTDIPTDRKTGKPRWLFRERKWLKEFLRYHKLKVGNTVTIHRLDKNTYSINPTRCAPQVTLFEHNLPPIFYAQKLAEQYADLTSSEYKKQRGQYFTPLEIASFMAKLAVSAKNPPIRILDPGAGLGILSCAVCEELAYKHDVKKIEIDTYENDSVLGQLLHKSLAHTSRWLEKRGIRLKFKIIDKDFVLSATQVTRTQNFHPYDLVVANPPYSKISANDPRAQAVSEVVYRQPNLYTLFMSTSAKLLKESGLMVFITPRSYTAGHYFRAFRQTFFAQMKPVRVHLFESRKDVFSGQSVLQENVILKAKKVKKTPSNITISTSKDFSNLDSSVQNRVPFSYALVRRKNGIVFRLPLNDFDDMVIEIVDSWIATLSDYNLQISTGPVVPFRAKNLIPATDFSTNELLVPLLWMRNIQPMKTIWPCDGLKSRKSNHQYIIDNSETRRRKLLLRNKNMVFLRRFSSKEQKRRLTAAPLFREQFQFEFLGIENHINYIHKPSSELSHDEVCGLAAILNSALLDRYFRIYNGNTQVSSTELRAMPLPPLDTITKLGKQLRLFSSVATLEQIDNYVWKIAKPFTKRKNLLKRLID